MSDKKSKSGRPFNRPAPSPKEPNVIPESQPPTELAGKTPRPHLFRKIDWWVFAGTALVAFIGYLLTLAPGPTLEDSGELATASFYAGVPHSPGYPVWTLYSWLFTVLIPFSNIAFRVAISSAVAAALADGMLGMLVSRTSSMILEGIEALRGLETKWENALCVLAGSVAAIMIGYNGFMWSQAVIVEVYPLSVLSLMGVLICLLHWAYDRTRLRYLYLAGFLFGICFNNHQTLIVASIGIEVLVALVDAPLGRNAFLVNSVAYLIGLILKSLGILTSFNGNFMLFVIYNAVGIGSMAAFGYLWWKTGKLGDGWLPVVWTFLLWIVGAAFYFYMPITSSTNPPMNWAYPRTWDGFIHAFTRGQYQRTNPTNIFANPARFISQLVMYFQGAADEFHPSYLLLALVPFAFLKKMRQRERAWILGNTAIYLCLAFLLLILLNPTNDKQSRDLTKVFFAASHVTIAMFVGFGLALIGAMLLKHYTWVRETVLIGAAVLAAVALFSLASHLYNTFSDPSKGLTGAKVIFYGLKQTFVNLSPTAPILKNLAAMLVLLLCLTFLGGILRWREHMPPRFMFAVFALIPLYSPLSHWADNEQHGHMFGYWYGHDMFSPPFHLYPPMAHNAILFGGTDPGRFCPTYMIFCESFIPPRDREDPKFNRRDVYIITQNALADNTYLDYIRAQYFPSAQHNPPFLHDMIVWLENLVIGQKQLKREQNGLMPHTNWLAHAIGSLTNVVRPFDDALMKFGKEVDARRRAEGVYPPKQIYTPSPGDLQQAYDDYVKDVSARKWHDEHYPNQPKEVKQGEEVTVLPNGQVQVSGQVAVMAINALLTKVIFDKNPTNQFYVEESFPLDWMYPYLTPYGIILRLNRHKVPAFTSQLLDRDHKFWTDFSKRLCGNWITYNTSIKQVCDFVDRVYLRGDLHGYRGDPKFVRDDDAQKAYSKLRTAQAGLFAWRLGGQCPPALRPKTAADRSRLLREADFAFKQAYTFCPYSPETLSRYASLLVSVGRIDDALMLARTSEKFDEPGSFSYTLTAQLEQLKNSMSSLNEVNTQLGQLQSQYETNTNDVHAAFKLAAAYVSVGQTSSAYSLLNSLVARSNATATTLLSVANAYVQLNQYARSEPALKKLVTLLPTAPEVWYDLAGAQAALGQKTNALYSLSVALRLSDQRLAKDSHATNLHTLASQDPRFQPLRGMPQFERLMAPK